MNSFLCERCGTEIRPGTMYAAWWNGIDHIYMHRFPYQCDPAGVEMVKRLEEAFETFQREACD